MLHQAKKDLSELFVRLCLLLSVAFRVCFFLVGQREKTTKPRKKFQAAYKQDSRKGQAFKLLTYFNY